MELREMRAFVVVDAGSFATAAQRASVSQSTISQTICFLEHRIGGARLSRPSGRSAAQSRAEAQAPQRDSRVLIPEVLLTVLAPERASGLTPQCVARRTPASLAWFPLIGTPIPRRTWTAWAASNRRRDVGRLVSSFDAPSA
jgi:Bacterial regulatory helix-turn-helix protein, lysR family